MYGKSFCKHDYAGTGFEQLEVRQIDLLDVCSEQAKLFGRVVYRCHHFIRYTRHARKKGSGVADSNASDGVS